LEQADWRARVAIVFKFQYQLHRLQPPIAEGRQGIRGRLSTPFTALGAKNGKFYVTSLFSQFEIFLSFENYGSPRKPYIWANTAAKFMK
jgi:hypothetical protein